MAHPSCPGVHPCHAEEVFCEAMRFRTEAELAWRCLLRGHLSMNGCQAVMRDLEATTTPAALAMAHRLEQLRAEANGSTEP
jgi:hypothetical protein